MLPYNEYQAHEHRKDLLRSAEQVRLARQASLENPLVERFGQALLAWGARLTVKNECRTVETSTGQTIQVCPA